MIAVFFHGDSVPESGNSRRFVLEKRVCFELPHCGKEQCANRGALQGKLIMIKRKHIINFTLPLGMILKLFFVTPMRRMAVFACIPNRYGHMPYAFLRLFVDEIHRLVFLGGMASFLAVP